MASPNNQQQFSLSPCAPDFVPFGDLSGPGVPGDPAPINSAGCSTVALMQGGAMYAMVFCQQFSMTHIIVFLGWIPTRSSRQEAIVLAGLPDITLNKEGLVEPIHDLTRWVNSRSTVLSSAPLKPVVDCKGGQEDRCRS